MKLFPELPKKGNFSQMEYLGIKRNIHPWIRHTTHIYQKRERNYVPLSKISIKFCKYFVSYCLVVTFVSYLPRKYLLPNI
jgi:hypothetical protein